MKDLEHPVITQVNLTGYPEKEDRHFGIDALGNEVFIGDKVIELGNEFVLKEVLNEEAVEFLEICGAVEKTASEE